MWLYQMLLAFYSRQEMLFPSLTPFKNSFKTRKKPKLWVMQVTTAHCNILPSSNSRKKPLKPIPLCWVVNPIRLFFQLSP